MSMMAFIPARGGSKGIPRKNLALLAGKPLIQYTVEAAQQSKYIDEIFVSSDDDQIIDFCKSMGVDVRYKRPSNLASDEAPVIDAVFDAFEWKNQKKLAVPEHIILLQPTSPLRCARHIDEAVRAYMNLSADSLISVHEMKEHPYECIRISGNGWSFLSKPARQVCRRQDYLDRFYYINGAIYIASASFIKINKTLFVENLSAIYIMEPVCGIDIDEPEDMFLAECLLSWRVCQMPVEVK